MHIIFRRAGVLGETEVWRAVQEVRRLECFWIYIRDQKGRRR